VTFAHALVAVATLATAGLAAFGLHLVMLALAAWRPRPSASTSHGAAPDEAVTVLVPCHREGESAARAVRSVLTQDHGGPITLRALLSPDDDLTEDALTPIARDDPRLVIARCPRPEKAAKLNDALADVDTPWVAFLDADHRADVDWLSRSVAFLHRAPSTTVAAQARRRPLAVRTLSQLWDAAQAHAGNERLNAGRDALGQPVFFTGTTAVFRRAALDEAPFGSSLTEDTELSYRLLAAGHDIGWLPDTGSAEEVAPDLASFVRRRRRWAAGHTAAAWRTLAYGPRPRGVIRAAGLLAHGVFYLAPVLALLALSAMGLYTGAQLDGGALLLAVVVAAGAGLALASRWAGGGLLALDALVAWVWCLPQAVLAVPLAFRATDAERYWLLIAFPGADAFLVADAILIALPLVFLLIAVAVERPFSRAHALRLVVSYPFFLVVEMIAVSLGLVDLVLGRSRWPTITRTLEPEATGRGGAMSWLLSGGLVAVTLVAGVLVHDLTLTAGCASAAGARAPLLLSDPRPHFTLDVRKSAVGHEVELTGVLRWHDPGGGSWSVRHLVEGDDGSPTLVDAQQPRAASVVRRPMGFDKLTWRARAERDGEVCTFERAVTTTVRRVRGRDLWLNGERFVLKGIVPSFALGRAVPDVETGLAQLQGLGANTVRYYHPTSPVARDAVTSLGLLTLDQPQGSTWDEVDLDDVIDRDRWVGRVGHQLAAVRGAPSSLLVIAGNELELHAPTRHALTLHELTRRLAQRHPGELWGYATFFLFVDYEAPVIGVNMLDTGASYWRGGLRALRDRGRPFFASELGAFVAFHEAPSLALRAARLQAQWRALQRAEAWGGVIFQSHDNWAQPLPKGINDPFTAEQPDDRRGLYDRDGRPSPLVDVVAALFSDVELHWSPGHPLVLHNRRPYTLRDLRLWRGDQPLTDAPVTLAPGEAHEVTLATSASDAPLLARYTTHGGLGGVSRLPGIMGSKPVLVAGDALAVDRSPDRLELLVVGPQPITVGLPDGWKRARLGDRVLPVEGVLQVRPPVVDEVLDATLREGDAQAFSPLTGRDAPTGDVVLRFALPEAQAGTILLAGLGTKRVTLSCHPDGEVQTHAYRELALPRAQLRGDHCEVTMRGRSAVFLPAPTTARGDTLPLPIEAPRWFHPETIVIERED
jgi:hypothetical protein